MSSYSDSLTYSQFLSNNYLGESHEKKRIDEKIKVIDQKEVKKLKKPSAMKLNVLRIASIMEKISLIPSRPAQKTGGATLYQNLSQGSSAQSTASKTTGYYTVLFQQQRVAKQNFSHQQKEMKEKAALEKQRAELPGVIKKASKYARTDPQKAERMLKTIDVLREGSLAADQKETIEKIRTQATETLAFQHYQRFLATMKRFRYYGINSEGLRVLRGDYHRLNNAMRALASSVEMGNRDAVKAMIDILHGKHERFIDIGGNDISADIQERPEYKQYSQPLQQWKLYETLLNTHGGLKKDPSLLNGLADLIRKAQSESTNEWVALKEELERSNPLVAPHGNGDSASSSLLPLLTRIVQKGIAPFLPNAGESVDDTEDASQAASAPALDRCDGSFDGSFDWSSEYPSSDSEDDSFEENTLRSLFERINDPKEYGDKMGRLAYEMYAFAAETAEKDSAVSQNAHHQLGIILRDGSFGVWKNVEKAIEHFQKANSKASLQSAYDLALEHGFLKTADGGEINARDRSFLEKLYYTNNGSSFLPYERDLPEKIAMARFYRRGIKIVLGVGEESRTYPLGGVSGELAWKKLSTNEFPLDHHSLASADYAYEVGVCLRDGIGVAADKGKAAVSFATAIAEGKALEGEDAKAFVKEAQEALNGIVDKTPEGDPARGMVLYALGCASYDDRGAVNGPLESFDEDVRKALGYFDEAAALGVDEAQQARNRIALRFGTACYHGTDNNVGVPGEEIYRRIDPAYVKADVKENAVAAMIMMRDGVDVMLDGTRYTIRKPNGSDAERHLLMIARDHRKVYETSVRIAAYRELAHMYHNGVGVNKDDDQYKRCIIEAVKLGDVDSKHAAEIYKDRVLDTSQPLKKRRSALSTLRADAKKLPEARYQLAQLYCDHEAVIKDVIKLHSVLDTGAASFQDLRKETDFKNKAYELLESASGEGHIPSKVYLVAHYSDTLGSQKVITLYDEIAKASDEHEFTEKEKKAVADKTLKAKETMALAEAETLPPEEALKVLEGVETAETKKQVASLQKGLKRDTSYTLGMEYLNGTKSDLTVFDTPVDEMCQEALQRLNDLEKQSEELRDEKSAFESGHHRSEAFIQANEALAACDTEIAAMKKTLGAALSRREGAEALYEVNKEFAEMEKTELEAAEERRDQLENRIADMTSGASVEQSDIEAYDSAFTEVERAHAAYESAKHDVINSEAALKEAQQEYDRDITSMEGLIDKRNDLETRIKALETESRASLTERADAIMKEEQKSVEDLEKAATHGHRGALYKLGLCYLKGKGVKADLFKGFHYILLSKGLPFDTIEAEGEYRKRLGTDGWLDTTDFPKEDQQEIAAFVRTGLEWQLQGTEFFKAEELGRAFCMLYGIGTKYEPKEAVKILRSHDENPQTLHMMAACYDSGAGVGKVDTELSEEYSAAAQKAGYAPPLGSTEKTMRTTLFGEHVLSRDEAALRALEELTTAADLGHSEAAKQVFALYRDGALVVETLDAGEKGVVTRKVRERKNIAKAARYLQQVVDSGIDDGKTLFDLAALYRDAGNDETSQLYFEKALEKGYTSAAVEYALGILRGDGKAVDIEKAQKLILQGAKIEKKFYSDEEYGAFIDADTRMVSATRISEEKQSEIVAVLEKLSEKDADKAMMMRSFCQRYGIGLPYNMSESFDAYHKITDGAQVFRYFNDLTEAKCAPAFVELALCYLRGKGTAVDIEKAQKLILQGADIKEKLYSESEYKPFLGDAVFADSDNNPFDTAFFLAANRIAIEKQLALFDAASKLSQPLDRDMMQAFCLQYGIGISYNPVEAFGSWHACAQKGNARAQYETGMRYKEGVGTKKSLVKALKYFSHASGQGYLEAMREHAAMLRTGILGEGILSNPEAAKKVEADITKAEEKKRFEELHKKAAEGNASAQAALGECYCYGRDVEKDYNAAVEWYTKAAEQGNADAQFNLGVCYYYGRGVEKDDIVAVEWYTKAATQGNADAQFTLGFCYEYGEGVEKDDNVAVEWFTKAARQGHEDAQTILRTRDLTW